LKHRQILAIIIALVIGAIGVLATQRLHGKPWRIKPGLDLAGGVRIVLQGDMERLQPGQKAPSDWLNSTIRIMSARINALGVSEPLIQPKGSDQVVVELPGMENQQDAVDALQSTAQMEFRHLRTVHFKDQTRFRPAAGKYTMDVAEDPKGNDIYAFTDAEGNDVPAEKILADSELILTGNDLKPVSVANKDTQSYKTIVSIEFTKDGKKAFGDFTRKNVGEILAIVLDGKILSAPSIKDTILSGRAQIEGNFTPETAQRLADAYEFCTRLPDDFE
jgi:preprotein translocase subunit SecD